MQSGPRMVKDADGDVWQVIGRGMFRCLTGKMADHSLQAIREEFGPIKVFHLIQDPQDAS